MPTPFPHADHADWTVSDPGLPFFIDARLADDDDLSDWWLDLGAVDFAAL